MSRSEQRKFDTGTEAASGSETRLLAETGFGQRIWAMMPQRRGSGRASIVVGASLSMDQTPPETQGPVSPEFRLGAPVPTHALL